MRAITDALAAADVQAEAVDDGRVPIWEKFTFLVALGSNLSALWILIANAWMQNPVGAEFNYQTMRMELVSIAEIIFNPVAQAKFVHTVAAGYVTASMFVLGISSWYLLKGRDTGFALRSFAVASGIEAEGETQKPPASFMIFGIPDEAAETSHYAIHVPWLLGLIATRSVDKPVTGIIELRNEAAKRIENGIVAYKALQKAKSERCYFASSTGTRTGQLRIWRIGRPLRAM